MMELWLRSKLTRLFGMAYFILFLIHVFMFIYTGGYSFLILAIFYLILTEIYTLTIFRLLEKIRLEVAYYRDAEKRRWAYAQLKERARLGLVKDFEKEAKEIIRKEML